MILTWEDKLMLLESLGGDVSLCIREPGNWYVQDSIEIGGDGLLISPTTRSASPEDAVEELWAQYTNLSPSKYLVARRGDERRHYRWNGYAFREVTA